MSQSDMADDNTARGDATGDDFGLAVSLDDIDNEEQRAILASMVSARKGPSDDMEVIVAALQEARDRDIGDLMPIATALKGRRAQDKEDVVAALTSARERGIGYIQETVDCLQSSGTVGLDALQSLVSSRQLARSGNLDDLQPEDMSTLQASMQSAIELDILEEAHMKKAILESQRDEELQLQKDMISNLLHDCHSNANDLVGQCVASNVTDSAFASAGSPHISQNSSAVSLDVEDFDWTDRTDSPSNGQNLESNSNFSINDHDIGCTELNGLKEPSDSGYVSKKAFTLTSLPRNHEEYKQIEKDLQAVSLRVTTVEKLENKILCDRYNKEKEHMLQSRLGGFDLHEEYLYHGSRAEKSVLCEESLDQRLGKRGHFGRGIYFSDDPRKCLQYCDVSKPGETSFILKCSVILGDSKVYPDGQSDKHLKREPLKETPDFGWKYYDSVKGRPKDYNEYVIYDSRRALTQYIIAFQLDGGHSKQDQDSASAGYKDFGKETNHLQPAVTKTVLIPEPRNDGSVSDELEEVSDEDGSVCNKRGAKTTKRHRRNAKTSSISESDGDDSASDELGGNNATNHCQRSTVNAISMSESDDDDSVCDELRDVIACKASRAGNVKQVENKRPKGASDGVSEMDKTDSKAEPQPPVTVLKWTRISSDEQPGVSRGLSREVVMETSESSGGEPVLPSETTENQLDHLDQTDNETEATPGLNDQLRGSSVAEQTETALLSEQTEGSPSDSSATIEISELEGSDISGTAAEGVHGGVDMPQQEVLGQDRLDCDSKEMEMTSNAANDEPDSDSESFSSCLSDSSDCHEELTASNGAELLDSSKVLEGCAQSIGDGDEAVSEVLSGLVVEFMSVTESEDVAGASSMILEANMNLDLAVLNYYKSLKD